MMIFDCRKDTKKFTILHSYQIFMYRVHWHPCGPVYFPFWVHILVALLPTCSRAPENIGPALDTMTLFWTIFSFLSLVFGDTP
jgi:hypothetical protein